MNTCIHNDVAEELTKLGLTKCDRKRILVVDDQKAVRDVFKLVITYELPECHIDLAENGVEAVEMFKKEHDGILLLDLHMPIMDGQTAFHEIEKICQAENYQMPSVLFCTGYQPSNVLNKTIENNASYCLLLKPISGERLVTEIKKRLAA